MTDEANDVDDLFTDNTKLRSQLTRVTDERDKAIERCAIFERAVDHYADAAVWNCYSCDHGHKHDRCDPVIYDRGNRGNAIAVKAKKDAEEVR